MLTLTVKLGDCVYIGEKGEIRIEAVGIKGNQVKLGFDAPLEIPIHREKIFNRIKNEENK